jgi:hypothetical protein
MTAVLPNGTIARLSPERTPGLWGAFAVSAGRLGVIVDVTLRIIPNAMTKRDVTVMSTTEMLADIAEVQADARAATSNGTSGDGLSTKMMAAFAERNYLWFMTREPEAPSGVWRADVSPYNESTNASAAGDWTRAQDKAFRLINLDARYSMQRIIAAMTNAAWEKQLSASTPIGSAGGVRSASVGGALAAENMTRTRHAGNATGAGRELVYDRNPSAWLRSRRGLTQPTTGALSDGFRGVVMGLDTRQQAEVTAVLLLEEFFPQISPKRVALVHQTAAMAGGVPDLMPYDQYEVAIPLVNASDCMTLVMAQLYDKPQDKDDNTDFPSWQAMRAPALIRFVAAEPENFLSPSWDGPKMYINIEDYVKYSRVSRVSPGFDAVMEVLQGDTCQGRLHWGKAGRRGKYDGGEQGDRTGAYGEGWCHFGCATLAVDPSGKFRGQWGGWNSWIPDALERCCIPGDATFQFDASRGCGSCTRATSKST